MASTAESTEDTNIHIEDLDLNKCPSATHLEALDGKISDREEQIELCTAILDDLRKIQEIVTERGLENTTFQRPEN